MHTKRCIAFVRALALVVLGATIARAQEPSTTLVVPFAPGGGADFVARQLADVLPGILSEPVTLVHRPGADGLVAVDEVARASPDGRTLLLGSSASMFFAPMATGRDPPDPTADFEPIAIVGTVPRIVIAHPSLQASNLDQLIRQARESPAAIRCGTADRLSQHAVRLFERQAGVRLDCTHYDGAGAMREDLVSGRVKLAFESAYLPEVQAGRLRALAVASSGRMKALPDVPTTSEAGLPGLEAMTWLALFAPKGTDRARIEQLAAAVAAAMRHVMFVSALESRGYVIRPMSDAQLRQYLQRDLSTWRRVVPAKAGDVPPTGLTNS